MVSHAITRGACDEVDRQIHRRSSFLCDETSRAHIYSARLTRADAQRQMTSQLVDGVFDGSRSQLVLAALGDTSETTSEELAEIRALLDKMEGREQ